MIVKGFRRKAAAEGEQTASGFDSVEMRLGDTMRGERATMGKSLLDVQRELKIKAAYIAAIENADPSAFDTPGFIAGYVRSYARYLNMDPDKTFELFCKESGFSTAHGMSPAASTMKAKMREERVLGRSDIFSSPVTPFVPTGDSFFSKIEPGAVGSIAILVALVAGLGYGGWTVLQEVQKVQFAPVENTPVVVADLDPLAGVGVKADDAGVSVAAFEAPQIEGTDRLYRPQALDVPVLIARDGPISALSPNETGTLAGSTDLAAVASGTTVPGAGALQQALDIAAADQIGPQQGVVQVTEGPAPELAMVAVRPAWVRVRSADGTVIFEGIMDAGDTYVVPQTQDPATVRVGESGGVYLAINGVHYGPIGERGTVTSNLALDAAALSQSYQVADITADSDLANMVNVAQVMQPTQ